jgi:predicted component of type VI protein secretion system
MAVNLIVLSGVHQGRRIPIAVPEFLIGRDPSCHLRPASQSVQWQHCAILSKRGRIFLRDETGTGGTLVNRRLLVGGEVELVDGDHIAVGPLLFLVTFEPEAPGSLPKHDGVKAVPHPADSNTTREEITERAPHHPRPQQPQTRNDAEEVLYL